MLSLHVISLKKYLHVHLWMYLCMFLGIYIYGVALLIGSILSTVKSALLIHGARKVFPISWPPVLFIYSGAPLLVKIFLCVVIGTIATMWHENCWHHLLISGERELHEGVGRLDWDRPVSQYLVYTNDILAFVIYLVVMIYLIMVVVSYKTEIESRSNAKSLPFQVVFLWCPSNLLGRWFYIKFSFKVVPKVAASAPAVDIASLRREWKKANVSDFKYQPFKWAGGQCCVHSWFINLFVLNWTHQMLGLF